MEVSSERSGAIAAALDRFEEQWLSGDSQPDVVSTAAALRQTSGFAERRVAWELAMCDLELRWRHRDPQLRRGSRWYAEQLTSFGLSEADYDELCLHELVVRSRWADRPAVAALLEEQHPGVQGELRRRKLRSMVQHLEIHFPLQCIVKLDDGTRFRTEVPSPCVFGRQRSADPLPGEVHLDAESDLWRMIVTPREQNRVSRNQLLLRRLAVHQISIEPLSRNVSCYLAEQRLAAAEPVVLEIGSRPHQVRFQNVAVRLFASA